MSRKCWFLVLLALVYWYAELFACCQILVVRLDANLCTARGSSDHGATMVVRRLTTAINLGTPSKE